MEKNAEYILESAKCILEKARSTLISGIGVIENKNDAKKLVNIANKIQYLIQEGK